jgi:hypothetical protein
MPDARSGAAIAPTTPLIIVDAAIDQDNSVDNVGDLVAVPGATV